MPVKLTLVTVAALTAGAAGVLFAGAPRDRGRAAPPRPSASPTTPTTPTPTTADQPTSSTTTSSSPRAPRPATPSAAPKLPTSGPQVVVPTCEAAGERMTELSFANVASPKVTKITKLRDAMAATLKKQCNVEHWSENMRMCIALADNYERAKIDCTDEPVATPEEVAALPPELRCDKLAEHVYALGKAALSRKFAGHPEALTTLESFLTKQRTDTTAECDQRPWTAEHRRCVADAKTHEAYSACP